jgi:acylglycerol lipase
MQNEEFNLVASDGAFLIGRFWKPKGYPHAVICIIHGLGEHSGRYDVWARRFCERGFIVYSVDLRGHGNSEGERGYINHLSNYMDDVNCLVRRAKHDWESLPFFLYGHSMGGNLVLNFLLKKRQDFSGAIITSPWIKLVNPPSPFMRRTIHMLDKFFPKLTFCTRINSSQLSSNIPVQTGDADDMVHGKISIRLFNELTKGAENILNKTSRFTVPLFFAHGDIDEITDYETTQRLADKIGGVTLFYPALGAKHELHKEPVADRLFGYLIYWMEKTMKHVEYVF